MEEYYFLFFVGFIWTLIAVFQDFKRTEIDNWVSYSLIAVILFYRGIYSYTIGDFSFFLHGLFGIAFFFLMANIFYYSGTFGGGDAKLMSALGGVLPLFSFFEILFSGLTFVLILFLFGAIYSFFWSLFLVRKKWKEFRREFFTVLGKSLFLFYLSIGIMILSFWFVEKVVLIYVFSFLLIMPFLYVYFKAFENSCMFVLTSPKELQEGDWILSDLKVGSKMIKKSVHGLSISDINLLKKYNQSIVVKRGIPFTISFLFVLIMEFFFLVKGFELTYFFSLL